MAKKILIDTSCPGNTRIVILNESGIIENLILESAEKKSIKSNIYLGSISRVEHSLQAAFVDYGGDKNGFLPFSEIHPDYYQIPTFDKGKLKENIRNEYKENRLNKNESDAEDSDHEQKHFTHYNIYKDYNIQEVIKRGQNVLVQVCRDERGNKGVSLTTYISLAGRYCVFMPNSPNGIGVSHKIIDLAKKKRLLSLMNTYLLEDGTSLIARTAAQDASEDDLRCDYNYLVALWNEIRNNTLKAKTMSVIYNEENIIRQTLRDCYASDIKEIIVDNKTAYDEVLSCLKDFAPNFNQEVVLYKGKSLLFEKYNIEKQIDTLLQSRVDLPSGGYIVINQTEALISIDVNSGKATNERNIEDTAVKINAEAATEIARQMRLRELGGLAVIDFIDMAELKNRKMIESHLQDAFRIDKARVQFTWISPFGLLELSRQRLRSSLAEISTSQCPHCNGSGRIKASDFVRNTIVRSLHTVVCQSKCKFVEIVCSIEVSNILLNSKNIMIDLESKYDIKISITPNSTFAQDYFVIKSKSSSSDTNPKTLFEYQCTNDPKDVHITPISPTIKEENDDYRFIKKKPRRVSHGHRNNTRHHNQTKHVESVERVQKSKKKDSITSAISSTVKKLFGFKK